MKIFKLWKSFFLFLTAIMCAPLFYAYGSESKSGVDVALLIDVSGSMKSSDKTRIAIEASKMFIDMTETQNSRIGVLAFNDSSVGIKELAEISSFNDKERLKNMLDNFQYDGYTDIGRSLKETVLMITENFSPENSPMILLLTDGKIEIDPENSYSRTVNDSINDINSALLQAGKNVPIYTIGLDYDKTVDTELLKTISEKTAARNYIVTDAESLPQIFNEIFADHIKSTLIEALDITADGENYSDLIIHIDSPFVSEANIIMLSSESPVDIKLFNPNGQEVVFDGHNLSLSKSNRYAMIKAVSPVSGDWLLQVKGVKNDNIKVNLIYQYNVDLDVSAYQEDRTDGKYSHEKPIFIAGRFLVNGEKISDDDLYKNTSAFLVLEDKNRNILYETEISYENGQYAVEYTPQSDEDVFLLLRAENEDFSKESARIGLEFIKPEITPVPYAKSTSEATLQPAETHAPKNYSGLFRALLASVIILSITLLIFVSVYLKKRSSMLFNGYLEVRAMGPDQVYTPLETPSLSTFVGKITLSGFFSTMLSLKTADKLSVWSMELQGVELRPTVADSRNAIILTNKSPCGILDDNENLIAKKTIYLYDNQRITIVSPDNGTAKIEMTYRIEEI